MDYFAYDKLEWRTDYFNGKKCHIGLVSVCPHCNKGMRPEILTSTDYGAMYIVLKCAICKQVYFAILEKDNDGFKKNIGQEKYNKVNPDDLPILCTTATFPKIEFKAYDLPEKIVQIYPWFATTYKQSEDAENAGLTEICGIGYRKALEILVKENLAGKFPAEKDNIYSETLSQSIARYKNDTVHKVAKAATWLGNDETHMIRRHQDYDVQFMKKLISVLVHVIEAEHIANSDLDKILNHPK